MRTVYVGSCRNSQGNIFWGRLLETVLVLIKLFHAYLNLNVNLSSLMCLIPLLPKMLEI